MYNTIVFNEFYYKSKFKTFIKMIYKVKIIRHNYDIYEFH